MNRKQPLLFALLLLPAVLVGCRTATRTGMLTGAAFGAGTGAMMAEMAGKSAGGGALIGLGFGLLTGGLIGNGVDRAREHTRQHDDGAPHTCYQPVEKPCNAQPGPRGRSPRCTELSVSTDTPRPVRLDLDHDGSVCASLAFSTGCYRRHAPPVAYRPVAPPPPAPPAVPHPPSPPPHVRGHWEWDQGRWYWIPE